MARHAQILASTAALLAFLNTDVSVAQGLESPETIEAIVGTPVHQEETKAAADPEKVIAAIDKSTDNISTVRKTTMLDEVEIVFLADAAPTEGGPPDAIEAKLTEKKDDVLRLRKEIEGNAMLYHALNSRQVILRDVLAIEFQNNKAVIYAAAVKPTQ
ncbi:hypothetical protein JYU29_14495 [Tianweitania sp. BSSL-BM11]|uniref:Uncharacterized protein n=1 Tax=Tianweitania aestuarii TaxID=2814886 RepID=A0ABS5RY37_9HYPH|nr:hypothetical protein [Tianweitania aestuarii]MBS9721897.1 hypothetical protein [Tianweitania aestuarii]